MTSEAFVHAAGLPRFRPSQYLRDRAAASATAAA